MQSRPRYETESDRDNEKSIAAIIAEKFNAEYRKMPGSYVLDYALLRNGKIVGFMECKRRRNNFRRYPTIFVALHKIEKAANYFSSTGLQSIFAVQWDDKIGYVMLNDPDWFDVGGRTDHKDSADQEPMGHYSIDKVKII